MSIEELEKQYNEDVNRIRKKGQEHGLTNKEIDAIFNECLMLNKSSFTKTLCGKLTLVFAIILAALLILYVLLNVHQPTASLVLQNVQTLIYPVLKLLRYLSVPVVQRYPHLTELYDESCLLENPYFFVNDMECWPCENVHSVLDLTGYNNMSLYPSGVPYIAKTLQKAVTYADIKNLYLNNSQVFLKDANKLQSSNLKIDKVADFEFHIPNVTRNSNVHISWRINRMNPARLIRQLFPRPYFITEWSGQSIERFVLIDEPFAEKYTLPSFECSYILLIQGSGERTIILKPSNECGRSCKPVSVILKPSYALWYNWWYWRPISLPGENTIDVSVSYITSFC